MVEINSASVIAVGTELTTGQITNRNAAWISEKLGQIGVEVKIHETIPDDRALIEDALNRCAALTHLIFVTGGLGPTSDDFTRKVIAKWTQAEMEFHPPSWEHIISRLSKVGIPIAESNRQQCYFPKSARVIANPVGTANAFAVSARGSQLWVLPGPPREVEAVWEEIGIQVRALVPAAKPLKLFTWQCIGKSEAELGEITERALKGSNLAIGYRAHRPYVEIKVWVEESKLTEAEPYLAKIEKQIAPWVATKQGEDLANLLSREFARFEEIEIIDACSGGVLTERLGPCLRADSATGARVNLVTEWENLEDPENWMRAALSNADEEVLTLLLGGFDDQGVYFIGMRTRHQSEMISLKTPFTSAEHKDRAYRMSAELALKQWMDWLKKSVN